MPAAEPEPPAGIAGVAATAGTAPALELLLDIDDDAGDTGDGAGREAGGPVGHGVWLPDAAFLHDWARHALGATLGSGTGARRAELSVRLVGAGTMRTLNRDWRGRDAPTNVLSFPSALPVLESAPGEAVGSLLVLGDLALCPSVIAAEARDQGKAASAHWAHLVVHGVLHLRGLDHESEDEARVMEALETRLLSVRELPDPYAEPLGADAVPR